MRCKIPIKIVGYSTTYPEKDNATIIAFFKTGGLCLRDGEEFARMWDWDSIKFTAVKL